MDAEKNRKLLEELRGGLQTQSPEEAAREAAARARRATWGSAGKIAEIRPMVREGERIAVNPSRNRP